MLREIKEKCNNTHLSIDFLKNLHISHFYISLIIRYRTYRESHLKVKFGFLKLHISFSNRLVLCCRDKAVRVFFFKSRRERLRLTYPATAPCSQAMSLVMGSQGSCAGEGQSEASLP